MEFFWKSIKDFFPYSLQDFDFIVVWDPYPKSYVIIDFRLH